MSKPGTARGHIDWDTGRWVTDGYIGPDGVTLVVEPPSEPDWDQAGADPDACPPGIDPYPPDDFGPEENE